MEVLPPQSVLSRCLLPRNLGRSFKSTLPKSYLNKVYFKQTNKQIKAGPKIFLSLWAKDEIDSETSCHRPRGFGPAEHPAATLPAASPSPWSRGLQLGAHPAPSIGSFQRQVLPAFPNRAHWGTTWFYFQFQSENYITRNSISDLELTGVVKMMDLRYTWRDNCTQPV